MTHLFINAFAASAGGGLTYIRNVIPHLGSRPNLSVTILLSHGLRRELGDWQNITFIEGPGSTGVAGRFWFEQHKLPALIRQSGANVLLSTGNFALYNALSRKSC